MAASSIALLLLSLGGQPSADRISTWVTFDVANPATIGGHRILHLEDIVGPKKRADVPGLPAPKVVLVFSASPEDCPGGPGAKKRVARLCGAMSTLATAKWAKGSLVVGVVLAKRETADVVRANLLRSDYPYPVMVDEHGLVSRALQADRPGVILVVDSNLGAARLSPPERLSGAMRDRYMGDVRVALESALAREKEDE